MGAIIFCPRSWQSPPTPQNRKLVDQQRVRFLKLEAKEKGDAADLATLLEDVTVTLTRKFGEKGTLFGSVTAIDIADKLAAQGYQIDKRRIALDSPLKVLGEYNVPIKLHREVTASIKVSVEGEGGIKAQPKDQSPPPSPAPEEGKQSAPSPPITEEQSGATGEK